MTNCVFWSCCAPTKGPLFGPVDVSRTCCCPAASTLPSPSPRFQRTLTHPRTGREVRRPHTESAQRAAVCKTLTGQLAGAPQCIIWKKITPICLRAREAMLQRQFRRKQMRCSPRTSVHCLTVLRRLSPFLQSLTSTWPCLIQSGVRNNQHLQNQEVKEHFLLKNAMLDVSQARIFKRFEFQKFWVYVRFYTGDCSVLCSLKNRTHTYIGVCIYICIYTDLHTRESNFMLPGANISTRVFCIHISHDTYLHNTYTLNKHTVLLIAQRCYFPYNGRYLPRCIECLPQTPWLLCICVAAGWGWAPRHPNRWVWQPGDHVCTSSVGETDGILCQGDRNSCLFWLYLLQGEGCRLTLHYRSTQAQRLERERHVHQEKSIQRATNQKTSTEKKWGSIMALHTPPPPLRKTKQNSSWQVNSSEHVSSARVQKPVAQAFFLSQRHIIFGKTKAWLSNAVQTLLLYTVQKSAE